MTNGETTSVFNEKQAYLVIGYCSWSVERASNFQGLVNHSVGHRPTEIKNSGDATIRWTLKISFGDISS
jgi:hypothetical protein